MKKLILLLIGFIFLFTTGIVSGALTDDLDNYFKFDEISGTIAVDSVENQNLTASNTRMFTSQVAGIIGTSADFSGGVDHIKTDTGINTSNTFSISVWVNSTVIGGVSQYLIDHRGATGPSGYMQVRENAGQLQFIQGNNSGIDLDAIGDVFDGTLHHVVLSINGTSLNYFLDGSEVGTTKTIALTSPDAAIDFVIGGIRDNGGNIAVAYNGTMDELGIWDRALKGSEVTELWNSGNGLSYPFEAPVDVDVNLLFPVTGDTVTGDVNFNASITPRGGTNLTNATLFVWDSDGALFTSATNNVTGNETNTTNFLVTNLTSGNYVWNILGESANATTSFANFSETNNTLTWLPFEVDAITFNPLVLETDNEEFELQITTLPNVLTVNALLNYNGTNYISDVSCVSGVCNITNDIDISLVDSGESENKSFFWQLAVFDGTTSISFNTSAQQQNINRVHLEECDVTFTTKTLNFTAFNEADLSLISPFEFQGNFQIWLGSGSIRRQSIFSNASVSSIQLCITPTNRDFRTDAIIEYDEASGANYTRRNYYFGNDTINSTSQNIGLGLLLATDSTSFILQVQDTDILPVPNVLIYTERFYPGLNEFRTVQIARTDDSGRSIGFFKTETVDYRFILKQNGTTVLTTGIQKIVGTSVPFTLTFTVGEDEGSAWEDFEELDDLTFVNGYNKTANTYTFTYTDTSGDFTSASLEIYKVNGTGDDPLICNVTSTQSAATLTCNMTGNSTGLYIAKGIIFRNGSRNLAFQEQFNIEGFSAVAGDLGLFLGFFIILIAAFAFRFNEIAGMFLINIAVIFVNAIGLIAFGPVFIGAMLAISIIIGVILER